MSFAPDWPLLTDRLELRPFCQDDLAAFHAMHADEGVARWLYNDPRSEDEARALLEVKIAGVALEDEGQWLSCAVALRDGGTVVGDLAFQWVSKRHRCGELGFVFDPAHQGNGYATEAAAALLPFAFGPLGLHRVIGRTEARNTGSARVLEKLGMRLEAHLVENEWVKDEWQSELVYAILEEAWRARSL